MTKVVYCEEFFHRLATDAPEQLCVLIHSGDLSPANLTFAAEALGTTHDSVVVRATLIPLLTHTSAVVREGALYGLGRHLDEDTKISVHIVACCDSSPGVRQAAAELLDTGEPPP